MTCRERAGQVRERYEELRQAGADVTAIGTGGRRYAEAFIEDEAVPFDVLLDEDGTAARLVEVRSMSMATFARPAAYAAPVRSVIRGHRQRKTGRRPLQLGATVVMAPPNQVVYVDREDYAGDHADLDEVLAAIRSNR